MICWGATGHAKVVREALAGTGLRLVALVDNRAVDSPFPELPVLRGAAGLDAWLRQRGGAEGLSAVVAVGGSRGRDRIELMALLVARGIQPLTVIHRTAFVAADASIGEGCQLMAQAAVCTQVRLGDSVIVNTAAAIDHDCVVGNGVHLAPGARLAGEVTVGERAFIGLGAVVLPRLEIGHDAIVGAGAVVTRHVAAGVTVVGNPARVVRAQAPEAQEAMTGMEVKHVSN